MMIIKNIELNRPYNYSDTIEPLQGTVQIVDKENGIDLKVTLSMNTIITIQELCSGDVKTATGIILHDAPLACIPDLLPAPTEV